MKKVYFNHSLLEGSSDHELERLVVETVEFKNILREIPLYVYEGFWSLRIQSGTLRSFLALRHNQDNQIRDGACECANVLILIICLYLFFYSLFLCLFCSSIKTSQGSKTQITKNTDFTDIFIF